MPEIFVPPGDAIEFLRDACGLNEGSNAALQARVRQLVEMGVTGLTRDTSHARHRYGLTELSQLAVAIALMKARVQPAAAARLVREGWERFVPFVFAGIGDRLPDRFRRLRPGEGGAHAFVEGNGLSELGRKSVRSARGGGSLPAVTLSKDPTVAVPEKGVGDAGTYLDATGFMPRLYELMVARAQAPEDVWESLTRLRQSVMPKA